MLFSISLTQEKEESYLRIHDLKKQYDGKTVVDSVSFEIHKGKVTSLIGPNGAGTSEVGTISLWVFIIATIFSFTTTMISSQKPVKNL